MLAAGSVPRSPRNFSTRLELLGLARNADRTRTAIGPVADSSALIPIEIDLSDLDETSSLADKLKNEFTHVDLFANIAGVWHNEDRAYYGPHLEDIPIDELHEVMNVGLLAPMILSRALLESMPDNSGCQILNLSGTFNSGGANWVHYFVSKRALELLTQALADENRDRGVRVNCVSPADTATPEYRKFFPEDADGALNPDYIADVMWSLQTRPEFHNISGEIIELRVCGTA